MAVILSAALIATGMVATSATVAQAAPVPGTLVFIKNNEVWMAKGDGTGQIQVSRDGNITRYTSPSMSDDGVITALKGREIVRMKTDGTILSKWDTGTLLPASESGIQHTISAHVSPNGKKVVYSQSAVLSNWSVTAGTRFSASHQYSNGGPQLLHGYGDAKWITDSRVIIKNYSSIYLHNVGASAATEWFNDEDIFPGDPDDWLHFPQEQWDPELSADGKALVTMRGPVEDPNMIVYTVTGNARTTIPAKPTFKCAFNGGEDEEFGSPTIAPNSTALAWQMKEGIWLKNNLNSCATTDVKLIIPGASEPSWSKVAYKAPKKNGSNSSPKASKKKFKVNKKPKVKGTVKVGKKLKVTKAKLKPKPAKIKYQWFRGKKKIKGATKAKYKIKRADKGKKLRVKVTVTHKKTAKKVFTIKIKKKVR